MDPSRVYEVYAPPDDCGTAYAVTDQLLVTAHHVVNKSSAIGVTPLNALRPMRLTSVTNGCHDGDVAVLSAKAAGQFGSVETVTWGTWRRQSVLSCRVCGFPTVEVNPETGETDPWEGVGEIRPVDAGRRGRLAINLLGTYPRDCSGLSGAPVFVEQYFVGVVTEVADPRIWVGGRLYAEPIDGLVRRMEELGLLHEQELVDFDVEKARIEGSVSAPDRYHALPGTTAKRGQQTLNELLALFPELVVVVRSRKDSERDVRRPHGPRRSRRKRR
jgi:hypothetical protein